MPAYTSQKEMARIQHRSELKAADDLLRYAVLATRGNGVYEQDLLFPNALNFEILRLNQAKERYLQDNPTRADILQNLHFLALPYDTKLIVVFCSEADLQDFYKKRVNASSNGGPTR